MLRFKYKYLYKIYYDYNISKAMDKEFATTLDMCPDDDDFSGPEIAPRLPTYREHKCAVKETNQIIRFAIVNNFNR